MSALLLAPANVSAQPAPPPYRARQQVQLQYAAGAGCPSQSAFVNEVGARIRRPIEWVASNPTTLIVVTLGQADDHATGKLEVTRHATEPTRREFIASSCAEVGSALALVTALTLDPNARTEPLLRPPVGSAASSAAAPVTVFPSPISVPPLAAQPSASAPLAATPPAEPAPAPRGNYAVGWLGPAAGASVGYAPKPLVTFGLALGARLHVSRGLSPSLQLTPFWGKTGSTGPSAAGGSFAWTMARLEACPTQFQLAASLALAGCAAAEAGRLSARGSANQIIPVTAERWWFAAGVTASLHFTLGHWFTRLGAQALFPATRDDFVFRDPNQHIHEASAVVYGASLGLGFQFGS
jgi:hypothetical protein